MTDPRTLAPEEVQAKLGLIGYQKLFKVIFLKVNGEQRMLTGMLEKPTKPIDYSKPVPVMDMEKGGWSSFKVDRVLYIGESHE